MSRIEEENLIIELQMAIRVELEPIKFIDLPFEIAHQFHRYIPICINNMTPLQFKIAVMNEMKRFDQTFEEGRIFPDKHWKHYGLYTDEFLNQISYIPEKIRNSVRIGFDKTYAFQFVLKTGYNVLTGFNESHEHYETDESGNWNEFCFRFHIDPFIDIILSPLHVMFEDSGGLLDEEIDEDTDWNWETYLMMGKRTDKWQTME